MTSADEWKEHPDAKVLPADADPDEEDNLVAPDEAPDERLEELKEKVASGGVEDHAGQAVATDGGQPDVDDEDDQDDQDEEEHTFPCPATGCDAENTGFPSECPECGAPYVWEDDDTTEN